MPAAHPEDADGQTFQLARRYGLRLWLAGLPLVLLLLGLAGWQAWQAHRQADVQIDHTAALYQSALQGLGEAAVQHVSDLRAVLALPLPSAFSAGQGAGLIDGRIVKGLQSASEGRTTPWTLDGLSSDLRGQTGQLLWLGPTPEAPPGADVLWRQQAFAQVAAMAQTHESELASSYYLAWPPTQLMLYPFASGPELLKLGGQASLKELLATWTAKEGFGAGLPAQKLRGEPFWTAARLDAGGKTWLISHAAPVERTGEFVGWVGTEIRLGALQNRLAALPPMAAHWWVISDRQEVLAESAPAAAPGAPQLVSAQRGAATAPVLADRLPAGLSLAAVSAAQAQAGQALEQDGFRLLALPVPGVPWTLVVALEEEEALAASALATLPLLLVALGLIGLFAAAQAALQGRVLAPLLALMAYLELKAADPAVPAPELGGRWQRWVDTITRTFDNERSALAKQRRSETTKGAIVDNALSAIVVTDAAGRVVEFNPAAERMFGYDRGAALGRSVAELIIPPAKRHGHEEGMRRMANGGAPRMLGKRLQMPALRADGSEFPIEMVLWRTDVEGEVHYTATLADMSQQQSAQLEIERQREALRQSEKLAAMGGLLAGVAHELNNPLAIAMGRASWLEERSNDVGTRNDARLIREATERCGRIVRTFLDMARSRPAQPEALELNGLVLAALDLLAHSLRSQGIAVRLELGSALPKVWADPDRLGQVLLNLLVNAQQALSERSAPRELRIGSGVDQPDAPRRGVWLRVADNGPGVNAALRERIFEPYFTTKPEGVGTGMGLSLSRALLEEQGGQLLLEPAAEGEGASFLVCLKCAVSVVEIPSAAAPTAEHDPDELALQRVLVVDDEPELAALWAEWLASAGYEVLRAESAEVALEMLDLCTVDALVSDLRMPGIDGGELWRRLRQRQPALQQRTLFVTGDALSPGVVDFLKRSGCPALEKPFSPGELVQAVKRLLAGQSPRASALQSAAAAAGAGPGTKT